MPSGLAPVDGFAPGHTRSLRHGANSERMVGPLSKSLLADLDEMCEGTPAAQPMFALARALLARKLAHIRLLNEYHTDAGMFTEKGYVRRSARFESDLLKSAEASLERLGLTPSSAAKLGVDLARGQSLADELRAGVEARQRAEARHA